MDKIEKTLSSAVFTRLVRTVCCRIAKFITLYKCTYLYTSYSAAVESMLNSYTFADFVASAISPISAVNSRRFIAN